MSVLRGIAMGITNRIVLNVCCPSFPEASENMEKNKIKSHSIETTCKGIMNASRGKASRVFELHRIAVGIAR